MKALEIPTVEPMRVRRFRFAWGNYFLDGGALCAPEFEIIEDKGIAERRLDFDEDIVDTSRRIFSVTNIFILQPEMPPLCVFPSRRWRSGRTGEYIEDLPLGAFEVDYIGNPVLVNKDGDTVIVHRIPEFLIKSGTQLQAEMEMQEFQNDPEQRGD